jgi:hypothetical protein
MTDSAATPKSDRPALPRDAFRAQRTGTARADGAPIQPVVVTPAYDDPISPATPRATEPAATRAAVSRAPPRPKRAPRRQRNPFEGYGERSSSRPYALRFPDAIDLVLRQIAAEERTHPLRIIDRIVHDHLQRIGRLPPPDHLSSD